MELLFVFISLHFIHTLARQDPFSYMHASIFCCSSQLQFTLHVPHSTCNNSWGSDPPHLCRLSHLVNPKVKHAGVQQPLWNITSALSTPLHQTPARAVVGGCTNTSRAQRTPPPPKKHKGGIYQYVLVTFRGQCCCRCITEVQLCISRPPCLFGARQQGSLADPHGVKPAPALSLSSPETVDTVPTVGSSCRAVRSRVQKWCCTLSHQAVVPYSKPWA